MSAAVSKTPSGEPIYLGRMARKRLEDAAWRAAIQSSHSADRSRDKRNRIAEKIPRQRPSCIKERLSDGVGVYVLLGWDDGRKVGKFWGEK